MKHILLILLVLIFYSCSEEVGITPDYVLSAEQKHNKFSSAIPPVIRVPSGSIIKVDTHEASDGQLHRNANIDDLKNIDFGPIHPLTGPVFIEEAEVGDILAVDLLDVELHDYGWQAIVPGFGFLSERFPDAKLTVHKINTTTGTATFNDKVQLELKPFPGVMGVAPATDEMLSTIPPRANGGNMDDPNLTKGTTVYFPIFVKGALFSIGDAHAIQGLGEVCGTAIEAPMTITYRLRVLKNKPATKKAVNYMIDHLINNYDITAEDAYMLCSLVGDLHIAEVVDVPNMLVTMHFPKSILEQL